jgi:AcrR family transcriptional regulator
VLIDKTETKNKVFMAAAELFASKGFYHVSVREICEEAGVSKPVLYYYFKDKEDLLFKLVEEMHSRQAGLFAKYLDPQASFSDNLNGLYELYLNFATDYPYLIKLSTLVHFSPLPSKIKHISHEKSKESMAKIIEIFEKGKKENMISKDVDTEMLAISLLGPVGIFVTRSILMEERKTPLEIELKKYFDFWINQFLNKN